MRDPKEQCTFDGEDTREGLCAVVSVKVPNPQFEGTDQGKARQLRGEGHRREPRQRSLLRESPRRERPSPGEAHRFRKDPRRGPGARSGPQGPGPDSPQGRTGRGRPSRQARRVPGAGPGKDRALPRRGGLRRWLSQAGPGSGRFQAVLPLRGKILNVEKARLDKTLASEEIRNIITALGNRHRRLRILPSRSCATTGSSSCATRTSTAATSARFLLTFFYRQMKELIERGHLYIAQPPLYKIKHGKSSERYLKDQEGLARRLPPGSRRAKNRRVKLANGRGDLEGASARSASLGRNDVTVGKLLVLDRAKKRLCLSELTERLLRERIKDPEMLLGIRDVAPGAYSSP